MERNGTLPSPSGINSTFLNRHTAELELVVPRSIPIITGDRAAAEGLLLVEAIDGVCTTTHPLGRENNEEASC